MPSTARWTVMPNAGIHGQMPSAIHDCSAVAPAPAPETPTCARAPAWSPPAAALQSWASSTSSNPSATQTGDAAGDPMLPQGPRRDAADQVQNDEREQDHA